MLLNRWPVCVCLYGGWPKWHKKHAYNTHTQQVADKRWMHKKKTTQCNSKQSNWKLVLMWISYLFYYNRTWYFDIESTKSNHAFAFWMYEYTLCTLYTHTYNRDVYFFLFPLLIVFKMADCCIHKSLNWILYAYTTTRLQTTARNWERERNKKKTHIHTRDNSLTLKIKKNKKKYGIKCVNKKENAATKDNSKHTSSTMQRSTTA